MIENEMHKTDNIDHWRVVLLASQTKISLSL